MRKTTERDGCPERQVSPDSFVEARRRVWFPGAVRTSAARTSAARTSVSVGDCAAVRAPAPARASPAVTSRGVASVCVAVVLASASGACEFSAAPPTVHVTSDPDLSGGHNVSRADAEGECPTACEGDFVACLRAVEASVRECLVFEQPANGACTTAGVGQAELCRQNYTACSK